jgi:predicted protein tyrosine phosphatase
MEKFENLDITIVIAILLILLIYSYWNETRILFGFIIGNSPNIIKTDKKQNELNISSKITGDDEKVRILYPPYTSKPPSYMYTFYWNFDGDGLSKIDEGLYLTSYTTMFKNTNQVKEEGIENVLSLGRDFYRSPYLINLNPKKIMSISIPDSQNINIHKYFDQTYDFIDNVIKKGGKIVVHCFAGMSRSASVVIAYLIRKYKLDYQTAYEIVSDKRPIINPNEGFVKQLRKFAFDQTSL